MTECYIFLKIEAGFVEDAVLKIKEMDEVKEANVVTGSIDAIVKVEGDDIQTISNVILKRIHRIDGIERTSTHFIVPL